MNKSIRNRLFVILAVTAVSLYYTFPVEKRINLGLDLKGGMNLLLKVETEKLEKNAQSDAVARAIEIIRNRIDGMGVGETVIQREGENEILIQIPGIKNREAAIAMVDTVAQLEFHLVNDNPQDLKSALDGNVPSGNILKKTKESGAAILLEEKASMTGERIADARVDFEQMGAPYIKLKFNSQGAKEFGLLTQKNIGRQLAIVLDGEVLSAPTIRDAIYGDAQITGTYKFEEASVLALALRSGSLPAPMHIEEERTIGPLLGQDSIKSGINATIYGGLFIFIFMTAYYLRSGVIASIALGLHLLYIFGIMGLFNALMPEAQLTLTLPGIAGIILTLGMSVDANVLINERIREELRNGRTMQAAIANGFSKALKAIIDSNVTTLIAAFMLFQFGSGPVKGFAVTLTLGIITGLFAAVFVSRTFFLLFFEIKLLQKLRMLSLFTNTKINFLSQRYLFLAISGAITLASIVTLIHKGNNAYGIDFVGGQIQEYKFAKPVDAEKLRGILVAAGEKDAVIQQFENHPETVIVRTPSDTYQQVSQGLKKALPDNSFEILRIERVGPVVGKALRKAAVLAMVFALSAILLYIGLRFKRFDIAIAGVVALMHDVFVTLGIVVMLNRQVDLLVVTALLTIAGYSMNDTIIVFDRVRENLINFRKLSLIEIVNLSINQTLSRTILTTFVTFLPVLTLFIWGGEVLNTFALCLIIGFITGTYSTVSIVSPLVIALQKKIKK